MAVTNNHIRALLNCLTDNTNKFTVLKFTFSHIIQKDSNMFRAKSNNFRVVCIKQAFVKYRRIIK